MTPHAEPLWTLDELTALAALALAVDYGGQPSGRVRDVPDRRTIRYYTTLGLLDRPAEMRGRTALYGRRHLLQLVAIKRLQARGLSLAEVQQRLLGQPDARLEALAEVPRNAELAGATQPQAERGPDRRRQSFWAAAPADRHVPNAVSPLSLQAVRITADITLLFAAARPVHADDLEAIQGAAAPLLKLLEMRRLRNLHQERENA